MANPQAPPPLSPPASPDKGGAAKSGKKGGGKKGGSSKVVLPTLEAAADRLAFCQAFSAKLGRHAVACRDLPAGTLILVERPMVAIPRSK